jgi:putative oxidoreductase
MTIARRFFATNDSRFQLAARVALGALMFPHGAQKLLGWFGGHGFSGTMGYFTGTLHVPAPAALLVILVESIGAIGLIAGLGTRLSALGLSLTMLGAVFLAHAPNGFFMNWFGNQKGEGFEYHLLVLAISIPLTIWGAGALSLDRLLARRVEAAAALDLSPGRGGARTEVAA